MKWCRLCSIAAMAVAALCTPAGVSADSINEKIDRERRTLEQLKDQIEEKRRQADEAGKKRESILQGIQTLDERHMRYRQSHQEINRKLRKKDQEIDAINAQIDRLKDGAFTYEMDDGAKIAVAVTVDRKQRRARVDFTGTSPQL